MNNNIRYEDNAKDKRTDQHHCVLCITSILDVAGSMEVVGAIGIAGTLYMIYVNGMIGKPVFCTDGGLCVDGIHYFVDIR